MPNIKLLRNIGTDLAGELGIDSKVLRTQYAEGKTVNAPAKVAEALIERKLAVEPGHEDEEPTPTPTPESALESTYTESPLPPGVSAEDAIASIKHMRDKAKLQAIVEHDKRVTVQNAANERLGSL